MITRVFVVIALFACNSYGASLQPSATREKWEDLEVITLDSQGNPAKTVYYGYDQLLTLPTVTVKAERDPNTGTPATYTGIYISDLFEAFGADASLDVIGANCLDKYKQYYDREYIARHRPILLLKFDGSLPDDWPRVSHSPESSRATEHGTILGPYCVVHESFIPETVYGYAEEPRTPYGVVSLELTSFTQSIGSFIPKKSGNDPEVVKGQKIVISSCISCHHLGNVGGHLALPSLADVAASAVNSTDKFRKYVTDPHSMNPQAGMPPYPTFDDKTFKALEAYFKAMMATQ
jgi:cytochrome c553